MERLTVLPERERGVCCPPLGRRPGRSRWAGLRTACDAGFAKLCGDCGAVGTAIGSDSAVRKLRQRHVKNYVAFRSRHGYDQRIVADARTACSPQR